MSVVLDAAAVLAVLLDEPGAAMVVPVLRGGVMSAINVSECGLRSVERGASAEAVIDILRSYEIEIVGFDLAQAIETAALRPATRAVGASLGDRACLALALARDLPVLTGDRRLADLDLGIAITLIR